MKLRVPTFNVFIENVFAISNRYNNRTGAATGHPVRSSCP